MYSFWVKPKSFKVLCITQKTDFCIRDILNLSLALFFGLKPKKNMLSRLNYYLPTHVNKFTSLMV